MSYYENETTNQNLVFEDGNDSSSGSGVWISYAYALVTLDNCFIVPYVSKKNVVAKTNETIIYTPIFVETYHSGIFDNLLMPYQFPPSLPYQFPPLISNKHSHSSIGEGGRFFLYYPKTIETINIYGMPNYYEILYTLGGTAIPGEDYVLPSGYDTYWNYGLVSDLYSLKILSNSKRKEDRTIEFDFTIRTYQDGTPGQGYLHFMVKEFHLNFSTGLTELLMGPNFGYIRYEGNFHISGYDCRTWPTPYALSSDEIALLDQDLQGRTNTITILNDNKPPVITSTPPTSHQLLKLDPLVFPDGKNIVVSDDGT